MALLLIAHLRKPPAARVVSEHAAALGQLRRHGSAIPRAESGRNPNRVDQHDAIGKGYSTRADGTHVEALVPELLVDPL